MLEIVAAGMTFVARWEEELAPRTVEAFRGILPFEDRIIHCRWSGESNWIPWGDRDLGIGPENATSYPHPGELALYPGGQSETELLFPYGYCSFASKAGHLWANHFATLVEGQEQLQGARPPDALGGRAGDHVPRAVDVPRIAGIGRGSNDSRRRPCERGSARSSLRPPFSSSAFAGTAGAATAPTGPPTAVGTGGAAATVETLATRAAVDTLRRGGNAVDAAVTAAAVLGVTEPFSCGIGGGGFLLLRTAGGAVTTVDHREAAPAAMRPDSFWEAGAPLPFNAARYSGLSVGVPGTVAGWARALDRYGTISLAEALQPAIRLAREGFVIDQVFFDQTLANADWFDDVPASAALFLDPDGTPKDVGTVFRNPDLARAYERIAHLGAKGFYRGAIADALTEAVQHPPVAPTANHVWRSGLMAMRDLHGYVAPEREPTRIGYRGLDVWGMGPPSSGGSTVGEALNILEGYPLATADAGAAAAPLPRGLAVLVRRPGRISRRPRLRRRAASGPPLGRLRRHAAGADHGDGGDEPGRGREPLAVQRQSRDAARGGGDGRRADVDDAHQHLGPLRQRRVVHVHDRVDRRRGARRPRLGLPAQQRAHRLRLRPAQSPEQRRGREAAAELDVADDRDAGRAGRCSRSAPRAARRSSRPSCSCSSTGSIPG